MAIDTAAKRASVLGFAFAAILLIPPDATIGAGDRQTLCHLYSGIAAAAPTTAPVCVSPLVATMRNTNVGAVGAMGNATVASASIMRNTVSPAATALRNTAVPAIGTMRNIVAVEKILC